MNESNLNFNKKNVLKNQDICVIKSYKDILQSAIEYFQIYDSYRELFIQNEESKKSKKIQIENILKKFIQDKKIYYDKMNDEEIIGALYNDMFEFSFLTKYINDKNIEEININSWEDIEINYSDGSRIKATEKFVDKEQAINIIRRMLKISGAVIDNSTPKVIGHLSKNIRIAVLKSPLVDEDIGIVASIRIVNPKKLNEDDFIRYGTATKEILNFISIITKYGISTIIAGSTGSGKTTLADWVLKTIPNNKRIVTIEEGSRELDLVKKDKDGNVVNSVIHTLTRRSTNENQDISQEDLIEIMLRFHPDIIVIAEVRGKEAVYAIEGARTGHTVITTIHANDCKSTYKRFANLAKKSMNIDMEIINEEVTEAFPIVIYAKQLDDKTRRITEIMECVIDDNGKREYRTLFRFKVIKNNKMDGKVSIEGYFEKVKPISKNMQYRLSQNGMSEEEIKEIIKI